MAEKFKKTMIVLAAGTLAASCGRLPARTLPSLPEDPSDRIAVYLQADEGQAERLLPSLTALPPDELEKPLREAMTRRYARTVPVGLLPDQALPFRGGTARFALYVPPSYDPERAYPLILCLHGAGFGGDAYLERWRPHLGEDYLLACPTLAEAAWWTEEGEALALAVLDETIRTYHLDFDRIYLTGMSNGGVGAALIGLHHADRFAAIIPMAGVIPPEIFPLLENAKQTPFYIIHGSKDEVMPVEASREMAYYLVDHHYPVIYREHAEVHPIAGGHFFPKGELPDLMAWLASTPRAETPREIVMAADRDHPGRSYWLRLDEPAPEVVSWRTAPAERAEEGAGPREAPLARLSAAVDGNEIKVKAERVLRYSLLIPNDLLDLSRPIRVTTNGAVSFEGRVPEDGREMLREARRRPDPRLIVRAVIEITVPR